MLFYTKNPRCAGFYFCQNWLSFATLLFIPAFILQIRNFIADHELSSYIIIIGFVLCDVV